MGENISSYISKIKRTLLSDKVLHPRAQINKKHYCRLYALFHPSQKFQPLPPVRKLKIRGEEILQNAEFDTSKMSNSELENTFRLIETLQSSHPKVAMNMHLTLASGERLQLHKTSK